MAGKNYSNFSLEEINALKQLKGYKDIVSKEADKRSAVFVWAWERLLHRGLYDHLKLMMPVYYELVEEDPLGEISDHVKQVFEPLV